MTPEERGTAIAHWLEQGGSDEAERINATAIAAAIRAAVAEEREACARIAAGMEITGTYTGSVEDGLRLLALPRQIAAAIHARGKP